MRCGCLFLIATGCGFHGASGSPDTAVPGGGISESHAFDVAELQAGQALAMTVDAPRRSLTPDAYVYGGLAAHGLQGMKLWTHDDTDWSEQAAVVPTGASLWRGEALTVTDQLDYLGITDPQSMSLWFEGEIWLDAGATESFLLVADDVAFVDLAQPGTASYSRVPASDAAVSVATPASGWYPIRIGFANGDAGGGFSFTHSDTAAIPPVAWTRDRLRARASQMSGALRTVFDHMMLGGGTLATTTAAAQPPVVHVEDGGLMPANTFPTALQGVEADNELWSARYAGQVYVTAPGMYSLIVNSDDANRVRLADKTGEAIWIGNIRPAVTTVTAALAPGWNDLIVDYEQVMGGRMLDIQLQSPDRTPVAIPHDQLRPVEPATDRLVYGSDDQIHTIQDNQPDNPAVATIPIAAYTGETVQSIEMVFFVNSTANNQLTADLGSPTGARAVVWQGGAVDARQGKAIEIPAGTDGPLGALLGGEAAGVWSLRIADGNSAGNDAALLGVKLTLHTSGGLDKVARAASWTSAPIDAAISVLAIEGITWSARTPAGTGAEVRFRTCQRADCSDDPAWSDGAAMATAYRVEPARYLQLRVDLTSDGTIEPELTSLAVGFRRATQ